MNRIWTLLPVIVPVWVAWLVLVAFFYPVGGDEPGYYYTALQMARGLRPVLDMFTLQPPGFFIPYALVAKLSHALEALRLVSVASIVATTLMAAGLARRHYGPHAGGLVFAIMALSHFWLYWNIQVIHYPIANVCLMAAFVLAERPNLRPALALAAGLAAGWSANSRLTMAPVAVVLGLMIVWRHARTLGLWTAIRHLGLPFVLGGVITSIPTLALVGADPDAFLFNFIGARTAYELRNRLTSPAPQVLLGQFLESRLGVLWFFFLWTDNTLKAQIPNALLLLAPALTGWRLLWARRENRRTMASAIRGDGMMKRAGILVLAIVATHFATLVLPYYFQPIVPLLAVIGAGLLVRTGCLPKSNDDRHDHAWPAAVWIFRLALVPYAAYYLMWTGGHILRRNEPSSARPVTAATVGCWLERHTTSDQRILSFLGLPVAVADRQLPVGFDYNNATTQFGWQAGLSEETAARYHLLSVPRLMQQLGTESIPVVVDDRQFDDELSAFPEIRQRIEDRYHRLGTTGGAFPYTVWALPGSLTEANLAICPSVASSVRVTDMRTLKGMTALVRRGVSEALPQITGLPRDVGYAVARIAGLSFEKRCGHFMEEARRCAGGPR